MIEWFEVFCWAIALFCALTAAVLAMRANRICNAPRRRPTGAAVLAPGVAPRRRTRRASMAG